MTGLDDANRQALRQTPLLKAAVEFHACPARYLHPDRWRGLGFDDPALFSKLASSPRGERKLSELVARRANLPTEGCFRFAEDRFRVALLPFSTLERLCSLASAATLRKEISTMVERTARQKVESVMGAEVREFAIKEAPVALGGLCEDHWGGDPRTDLSVRFQRNRTRCLEDCLSEAPPSLTERLKLKLPPSWECHFEGQATPENAERAWTIVRRLLRTKIPERGGPCFA